MTKVLTLDLIRELGAERWQTLCVLHAHESYALSDRKVTISADELAQMLGVSRETAARRLRNLVEFRFQTSDGEAHLVTSERNSFSGSNVYRINCDVYVAQSLNLLDLRSLKDKDLKIKDSVEQTSQMGARDVISLFCTTFKDVYHDSYRVSPRESGHAKNLASEYDATTLQAIITTGISEYDRLWSKQAYPRPSIVWLACGGAKIVAAWLAEQDRKRAEADAQKGVTEAMSFADLDAGGLL